MAKKPKDDESVLSLDIIETILLKLPLHTVLKLKSVCKSWQALISDPRFLKSIHIQRHKLHNLFLLWGRTPDFHTRFSLVRFENGRFQIESELGIPFGHGLPLCSYNHLVLLRRLKLSDEYVLWNPSSGTYSKIPMISGGFPNDSYAIFHDSTTDDYKVVVTSSFKLHYAVFSCKSTSWGAGWRSFPSHRDLEFPLPVKKGVFFNGSIYLWNHEGEIVCFDFSDDKMKVLMQLPSQRKVNGWYRDSWEGDKLIVLSGRLCLRRRILYSGGWRRLFYSGRLHLWVMERDGEGDCYYWRELMNVKFHAPDLLLDDPICLTKEDDVVFAIKSTSMFVVYKYSEKRFEESWKFPCLERSHIDSFMSYRDFMIPCSESPFFPIDDVKSKKEEKSITNVYAN